MPQTIVAIDVGTTKVCTLVAQLNQRGQLKILGVGVAPSKGLDKGVVVSIDQAASAIEASIERAERLSGYRIGTAYVSVSGQHIASHNSRGVVAVQRPESEITPGDVNRAIEAAQAVALPGQREILHVIPRIYSVDGHQGIRDPLGMSGTRLEVEAHIVTGEAMVVQNLMRSVQKAGVGIDELVPQPLASGEALLTPEDKERGVMLVDIGAGTTSVAIFAQGEVFYTGVIAVGGHHVTNDITYILRTPQSSAEQLKLQCGSAIAGSPPEADDPDDQLEIETLNAGEKQNASRHMLCSIIQARAEQLAELIYQEFQRSNYAGMLPAGIVLTGGGAQLARLDELIYAMLGLPVRIGMPTALIGLTDTLNSPVYSASVGLLHWSLRSESLNRGYHPAEEYQIRGTTLERVKGWLSIFLPR